MKVQERDDNENNNGNNDGDDYNGDHDDAKGGCIEKETTNFPKKMII